MGPSLSFIILIPSSFENLIIYNRSRDKKKKIEQSFNNLLTLKIKRSLSPSNREKKKVILINPCPTANKVSSDNFFWTLTSTNSND